jgi:hypothetical protein
VSGCGSSSQATSALSHRSPADLWTSNPQQIGEASRVWAGGSPTRSTTKPSPARPLKGAFRWWPAGAPARFEPAVTFRRRSPDPFSRDRHRLRRAGRRRGRGSRGVLDGRASDRDPKHPRRAVAVTGRLRRREAGLASAFGPPVRQTSRTGPRRGALSLSPPARSGAYHPPT